MWDYELTTGLEYTEQSSADCEGHPAVNESHTEDYGSPGDDEETHPESGTDFADDEVGWEFEDCVTDEEDQEGQRITSTNVEAEVRLKTSDVCGGDVRSVEERHGEDDTQHREDSEVCFPPTKS